MRIIVDSLIEGARRAHGTVVIIDVFRAFTTEAVAFQRGAKKIILVGSPEEALRLRNEGIADLCVGEVRGIRPPEFDYNNSPYEMSQADLEGKVIAHSTMAGTVGVNAATNADTIYVGSLVIARSTVEAILRDAPDLVTIVAMGDGGKIRTDEDEQCALYMRNLIEDDTPTPARCAASSWPAIRPPSTTTPPSAISARKTARPPSRSTAYPSPSRYPRENGMLVSRPVGPVS